MKLTRERKAVLELIRRGDKPSRVELSRQTGLSLPTLTNITRELITGGVIRERGVEETSRGRKPVLLEINPELGFSVGLQVDHDSVHAIAMDFQAGKLGENRRKLAKGRGEVAVVEGALKCVAAALGTVKEGKGDFKGIGVGVVGLVDDEKGTISFPGKRAGKGVPLRARLEREFRHPVRVENSVKAATMAENWFGAGRGADEMLYLHIGAGVGMGIIATGELYTGRDGHAGELGHTTVEQEGPLCYCGNHGCLERMCSSGALMEELQRALAQGVASAILEMAGGDAGKVTAAMLYAAAKQGDRLGGKVLARGGAYAGIALANLVNIFNPELVVLGGEVLEGGEAFLRPLRETMRARSLPSLARGVRLVPAGLGNEAGVTGAAALVLEEVLRSL